LVALVDAPLVVKSLTTTPTSRPSIRPKPVSLPSRGVPSASASMLEAPSRPTSAPLGELVLAAHPHRRFAPPVELGQQVVLRHRSRSLAFQHQKSRLSTVKRSTAPRSRLGQ
jgi:hypothetical protein